MADQRLRLGTRRSALAWIQSSQVAAALQSLHPGISIELVGIDTRGDRITDRPLSQVEGKEFFTAEIDAALREGRVDITVHSLKDLSLERPAGLHLAATPKRANPRDIILFAPDVPARLAAAAPLVIGTSSPRRAELLPPFLATVLPHSQAAPRVELVELRGNVDSRLRRLREPRGSARHLDGVVLAMAGLTRLFADRETQRQGHALLVELLQGLPLMLMPLDEVPTAPGQGALAIECREDDAATRALLAALDDAATRTAVAAERGVLAKWGGGCHQRFGVTQVPLGAGGALLRIAGRRPDGADVRSRHWLPPTPLPAASTGGHAPVAWDGTRASTPEWDALLDAAALRAQLAPLPADAPVFIAHSRALPAGGAAALAARRVWTSGVASWRKLAAQGVWVEGCAEGLGIESAWPTLAEPLLRLPARGSWIVLTHAAAVAGWQSGHVLATYQLREDLRAGVADEDIAGLQRATHVYWTSTVQFEHYRSLAPRNAVHAAGAGKTFEHLQRAGAAPLLSFPSVTEWRAWLGLPAP